MTFENCYFVQFYLENNLVVPVWDRPLEQVVSKKYPNTDPFWTLPKPSKFGYKQHKNATHWGIFDLSKRDPKCVYKSEFKKNSTVKLQLRGLFLSHRMRNEYFSFRISRYETVAQMLELSAKG